MAIWLMFFTNQTFLPTIHYYLFCSGRLRFFLDFLFFFLIALRSKCLKNKRMQRLGIFSLNYELYTFFFIRNHFIRNLVLYLPFHSPTFPYYILTSWTWKERRISNRNQLTHGLCNQDKAPILWHLVDRAIYSKRNITLLLFLYGKSWKFNLHNLQSIFGSFWLFRAAVAANIFHQKWKNI